MKKIAIYELNIDYKGEEYIYIGSTIDYIRRKSDHMYKMKIGKHENRTIRKMFNEIAEKLGEDAFDKVEFTILQEFNSYAFDLPIIENMLRELEEAMIETIYHDLKSKAKEHLLLNKLLHGKKIDLAAN